MLTEKQLLENGEHVRCLCNNVIPVSDVHCRYCHKFNFATTAKHCPTCGKLIKESTEPVVPV